jgi:AbrB family looped-hinge helix DNA binding protein
MKATGIIRRMDDIGRVVIPKEIRRQMKIKEGCPLEIFTHNGAVCFKPYRPLGEKDWGKAKSIVEVLLPCGFALLDYYEEVQVGVGDGDYDKLIGIVVDGETVAFLAVNDEETADLMKTEIPNAVMVLQKLFADEG